MFSKDGDDVEVDGAAAHDGGQDDPGVQPGDLDSQVAI